MTREEAIKFGKTILMFTNKELESDKNTYEFTTMAIEALSAQPCEQIKWERDTAIAQLKELGFGLGEKPQTSEDCISRAEAIKALEYDLSVEADGGLDKYRTVIKDLLNAIYNTQKKAIEDLPSVQPIRPKGEWIDWNCSCCGYGVKKYKDTRFCAYCGADMRGKE